MSFLTDEERLELLGSAITALGKLYQDLAHAPSLALIHDSEVKKIGKRRRTEIRRSAIAGTERSSLWRFRRTTEML